MGGGAKGRERQDLSKMRTQGGGAGHLERFARRRDQRRDDYVKNARKAVTPTDSAWLGKTHSDPAAALRETHSMSSVLELPIGPEGPSAFEMGPQIPTPAQAEAERVAAAQAGHDAARFVVPLTRKRGVKHFVNIDPLLIR